ncbi:MAG: hypothetical protein Q8M20_02375 [Rhodocyclaceae bacterium]|nr:hypothetical protein [Rhodocyclaceae bacterium]MDZ4213227.1 hypothetical protein [Rhodocyclaceae bacterium]
MTAVPKPEPRLLCFHKQGTSARTRFVRWPHGMLAFEPLPAGAKLLDEKSALVRRHPADVLVDAAARLGMPADALRAETEFGAVIATPEGDVPVFLVQFTSLDPPFAEVEKHGGKFIAITEARDCGALELALLRKAYEIIIG